MSATCHPIPPAVAQEMLQGVVEAICDRPEETAAQREARALDVVRSVLAFMPRDPVEIMLAGLAVGHYHLILGSLHEAFGAAADGTARRVNSGIAGLDRALTGLLKELRIAQTRPLEEATDLARQDAAAARPAATREAEARQPAPHPGPAADCQASDWRDAAPEKLLPPLRRTETSGAAMAAVSAPPVKPAVVGNEAKQAAANARPKVGSAAQASPDDVAEDALPGLAHVLATLRTAAEKLPVAQPGA